MKILIFIFALIAQVMSHGFLWEPASRATLGLQENNVCNVLVDFDHNGVFCGGRSVQIRNNGKCGICGDAFDNPSKNYEIPGKFATGIITRSYKPGQVMEVLVDIVAYHKGFLAFSLCENNNPRQDPTQECFKHRLRLENGTDVYFVSKDKVRQNVRLQLPAGLECWHCILQWNYITGNNAGVGRQNPDFYTEDCDKDKVEKVGCGPQETFRNCADICIGESCETRRCQVAKPFPSSPPNVPTATTVRPTSTTTTTATSRPTSATTTTANSRPTSATTTTATSRPTSATTTVASRPISSTTTTTAPRRPPASILCKGTSVVKKFASSLLTMEYCVSTCLNKQLDYCNLFLCTCQLDN